MRCMSFYATTSKMKNKSKTQTRRTGWRFLKKGDRIEAVVRYRGVLKKDRESLGIIEVTKVRREALHRISKSDVKAEGFPSWTPQQFIDLFCMINKCMPFQGVTVIDFRYVS